MATCTYVHSEFFCPPLQKPVTVETMLYADLSTVRAQSKAKGGRIEDKHEVTYATVDIKATKKHAAKQSKTATLPANGPPVGESHESLRLLDKIPHSFAN